MNHLIEYDEFINEGAISNKIELWKSKISTVFKSLKNIQRVLGSIIGILSIVGLATMGLLAGILYIHVKYPEFAKECVSRSNRKFLTEKSDQDHIIEQVINKFYNDEDLQKMIKEAGETKNVQKIKAINVKLNTIFTEEEKEYLNNMVKYLL